MIDEKVELQLDRIYFGDNIGWLKSFPNNSVDLVYIDPQFNSHRDYGWDSRNDNGSITRNDFQDIIGIDEVNKDILDQIIEKLGEPKDVERRERERKDGVKDINCADIFIYLAYMRERLELIKDILKSGGSIYLHCDQHASHYLKRIMDDIFEKRNFMSEIVWHYTKMNNAQNNWIQNHDVILFYVKDKSKEYVFNVQYEDKDRALLERFRGRITADKKLTYGAIMHHPSELINNYVKSAKLRLGRVLTASDVIIDFSDNSKQKCDNVWDIPIIKGNSNEKRDFETQKPKKLIERIILASSNPGQIVLDPFVGSGTTLEAAKLNKRHFIGIEKNRDTALSAGRRVGLGENDIIGLKTELELLESMSPHDFELFVCRKMHATCVSGDHSKKNTNIDGIVNNELGTCGYGGSPIQIKKWKHPVGQGEIVKMLGTLNKDHKKNGFLVALSFAENAYALASQFRLENNVNIRLVDVKKDLCGVPYYQGYVNNPIFGVVQEMVDIQNKQENEDISNKYPINQLSKIKMAATIMEV